MSIDITNLTLREASEHLRKKDFSSEALTETYLEKIDKENPEINAFLEVYDDVLEQAKNADLKIKRGEGGTFTGIPIALKDNILLKGQIASAGSHMLANYHATYTAGALAKLKEDGAVFLGRTNMDEFAMGGSTEHSCQGHTKNPLDHGRVPGGSSGGSAATVSGRLALASLGSDTGGSIRQPASYCGIVGLKPTYGTVSRSGLIAMASSLDQIGPMGKTVADTRMLFEAIRGYDPKDSTSFRDDVFQKEYGKGKERKKKYRVGVPEAFIEKGIDSDVLENFRASLKRLEKEGHIIEEVKLPSVKYALSTYYIIMPAEASSNLARYDGVKYGLGVEGENIIDGYQKTRKTGFGGEVRRRIILGTFVLSAGYYDAYYNKAVLMRRRIRDDFDRAFEEVDVIATPTTPTPAFRIGEKVGDPIAMYTQDLFTTPANITGLPALSVPSGTVKREKKDLPVGFHMTAPNFQEETLFQLGRVVVGENDE